MCKRVLVTGGAGFIGSHLVDALRTHGNEVEVVDDLSIGRADRLDGVPLHQVSVTDSTLLSAVCARLQPELIYHLAAQADVRVSVAEPARDAHVNVIGTIVVLQAALATSTRVVMTSTGGAIYGATSPIPTSECVCPEPEAPYGTAKWCAELYLELFNRLYGTAHTCLRLANVYGPRQDPMGEAGVVSIFSGRVARGEAPTVFGDGRQTRDYVYVGDVVRALLLAGNHAGPGTWNIGTGRETSVIDLIDILGVISGKTVSPVFAPARQGELRRSCLDPAAAARDLEFEPTISITEGIRRVYGWVVAGERPRVMA